MMLVGEIDRFNRAKPHLKVAKKMIKLSIKRYDINLLIEAIEQCEKAKVYFESALEFGEKTRKNSPGMGRYG